MTGSTLKRVVLVAALLLVASHAHAQESPQVKALLSAVGSASPTGDLDDLPRLAVDAGEAAVPALRKLLLSGESEPPASAALALAYIGGADAVAALRAAFEKFPEARPVTALDAAMASLGQDADTAFLRDSLKGPQVGLGWPTIVAAALSLGVLRDRASLETLRTTAGQGRGTIAASAAADASEWIETGRYAVDSEDVDPRIAAVLRNGIPDTAAGTTYVDSERHVAWHRAGGEWSSTPVGTPAAGTPTLDFKVHTSPDGLRALVSVGVTYGPLDGEGFDFVLAKEGDGWKVRTLFFTWIS